MLLPTGQNHKYKKNKKKQKKTQTKKKTNDSTTRLPPMAK
jgi:hypothetical protein